MCIFSNNSICLANSNIGLLAQLLVEFITPSNEAPPGDLRKEHVRVSETVINSISSLVLADFYTFL